MFQDDTILPIAYSFRGEFIKKTHNFFTNNLNPDSYDSGFIYPEATLTMVYTSKLKKNYYKVFLWEWNNRDKDTLDTIVKGILKKKLNQRDLPNVSFILDSNCKSDEYKKIISRISTDFQPIEIDFYSDMGKDFNIDDMKKILIN